MLRPKIEIYQKEGHDVRPSILNDLLLGARLLYNVSLLLHQASGKPTFAKLKSTSNQRIYRCSLSFDGIFPVLPVSENVIFIESGCSEKPFTFPPRNASQHCGAGRCSCREVTGHQIGDKVGKARSSYFR